MEAVLAGLRVEGRHRRLCEQMAALHEPSVADVMRVFLEVSTIPAADEGLWSLEFAFDEDDDRIARLEARFWDASVTSASGALPGYEVLIILPVNLGARSPDDRATAQHTLATAAVHGSLVARFVRSLTELGAYLRIEPVAVLSVEAHVLSPRG